MNEGTAYSALIPLKPETPFWTPLPHQITGVKLAISQACCGLLMDPGLGKTTTILEAFRILKEKGYVDKMLVIAPLKPLYNSWAGDYGEIEKWENFKHFTWTILHGDDKDENVQLDADIYLVNPHGLQWLFDARFEKGKGRKVLKSVDFSKIEPWGDRVMLVVDESTRFKSHDSQWHLIMRRVVKKFRRRYIMTGTPDPNGLIDLFGQVYILDEGAALGAYITHYRNNYFYPSYDGFSWLPQPTAFERISKRIAPITVRMEADDYLKLPERVTVKHMFDLSPKARAIYDDMEEELIVEAENDAIVADNQAVASGKCRQITAGFLYKQNELGEREVLLIHEDKMDLIESVLEELGGAPFLLFYEFDYEREMIAQRFKYASILGNNERKNSAMINGFNAGEVPLLVGQTQATSMGLNLQKACCHVGFSTETWKADDQRQAIDRIRRQGNPHSRIFVHSFLARKTIDEIVFDRVIQKQISSAEFAELLRKERARRG